jgi:hypothetical protein
MTFHQMMRRGCTTRHGSWGFTGQHTNPVRNARRAAIKKAGGIRQFKRQQRKRDLLI